MFLQADQGLYTFAATLARNHIIIVSNYVTPRAFVVPVSTILSNRFDPSDFDRPISAPCFSFPQPALDCSFSGIRMEFDSELEAVSSSVPPFLHDPSFCYKIRAAVIVCPSRGARTKAQVWWYTMYLYCRPTGNSAASLQFTQPEKGSHYPLYISTYGLERGLLWCVALGLNSELFLERPGMKHWPILRSSSTEFEVFDATSGMACAFSNSLGDHTPFMYISSFKGETLKRNESEGTVKALQASYLTYF